MICVAPFAHVILLLNAYDTLGNVILKKTDCTAKFTDTVVISDQCVVRIDYIPEFLSLGEVIYLLQENRVNAQQGCPDGLAVPAHTNISPERIVSYRYFLNKETVANVKSIGRELSRLPACVQASGLRRSVFDGSG